MSFSLVADHAFRRLIRDHTGTDIGQFLPVRTSAAQLCPEAPRLHRDEACLPYAAALLRDGGRLRAEFGAALGLGAKISFDLDIGGAVDGVKNLASKTFQTIKDSVPTLITKAAPVIESAKTVVKETAKEVVNAVGDAIVNLTKKVFSWW